MGSQTRRQPYPFSLRTASIKDETACGYRFLMYLLPPKDALTIERLHTHFVFQFASGVDVADRYIQSIGIADEVPLLISQDANYQRRLEINQTADSARRIDVSIDLTSLLKNDDVAYQEDAFDSGPENGYTMVDVLLSPNLNESNANYLNVGTIELWKIDSLYTTIGIR